MNALTQKTVDFILAHKKVIFTGAAIIDFTLLCAIIYCIFN
jgi:hypothetical protein